MLTVSVDDRGLPVTAIAIATITAHHAAATQDAHVSETEEGHGAHGKHGRGRESEVGEIAALFLQSARGIAQGLFHQSEARA